MKNNKTNHLSVSSHEPASPFSVLKLIDESNKNGRATTNLTIKELEKEAFQQSAPPPSSVFGVLSKEDFEKLRTKGYEELSKLKTKSDELKNKNMEFEEKEKVKEELLKKIRQENITLKVLGTCWQCGKMDHTRPDCPDYIEWKSSVVCYYCRQTGHVRNYCPLLEEYLQAEAENNKIMSEDNNDQLTSFKPLEFEDNPINFLIPLLHEQPEVNLPIEKMNSELNISIQSKTLSPFDVENETTKAQEIDKDDDIVLFELPAGTTCNEIKISSVKGLKEGSFISDVIVEFVLHHIILNELDQELGSKFFVYPPQMFESLKNHNLHFRDDGSKRNSVDYERNSKSKMFRNYEIFMSMSDIITKDFLIFPVCLEFHWILCIISLKDFTNNEQFEPDKIQKEFFKFILMDSYVSYSKKYHESLFEIFEKFIQIEFKELCKNEVFIKEKHFKRIVIDVPQQKPMSNDCVPFLINNFKFFFSNLHKVQTFDEIIYNDKFVCSTRFNIYQELKKYSLENQPESIKFFPKIQFSEEIIQNSNYYEDICSSDNESDYHEFDLSLHQKKKIKNIIDLPKPDDNTSQLHNKFYSNNQILNELQSLGFEYTSNSIQFENSQEQYQRHDQQEEMIELSKSDEIETIKNTSQLHNKFYSNDKILNELQSLGFDITSNSIQFENSQDSREIDRLDKRKMMEVDSKVHKDKKVKK